MSNHTDPAAFSPTEGEPMGGFIDRTKALAAQLPLEELARLFDANLLNFVLHMAINDPLQQMDADDLVETERLMLVVTNLGKILADKVKEAAGV